MNSGDIIGGRYQILYPLAEGGFGRTFVAQDNHRPSNPQCVVKYLKPHDNNPRLLENAKRLFFEEAKTLEKLGLYSQIPELLAYFAEGDNFFLVQEFIKGHTLTKEFNSGQPWNEIQICQTLFEVSKILDFIHNRGVIHRDIKPDNLIRQDDGGKLVLVDFGAVKDVLVRGQGSSTIVAGTPGYMPTEQGWGRPRYSSDIFALGMIGVQAATGLVPTAIQEDNQTGELIWSAKSTISDELAAILKKMVRYHFNARYQTAMEVIKALSPLLSRYGIISPGELSTFLPQSSPTILSDAPLSPRSSHSESDVASAISADELLSDELPDTNTNPSPTVISISFDLEKSPEDHSASLSEANSVPSPTIILDSGNIPQAKEQYLDTLALTSSSELLPKSGLGSVVAPFSQEPGSSATIISEDKSSLSENELIQPKHASNEQFSKPNRFSFSHLSPQFLRQNGLLIGAGALLFLGVSWLGIKELSQYFRYRQAKDNLEQIRNAKNLDQYTSCVQEADNFTSEFPDLETESKALKSDCQLGQAMVAQSNNDYTECIEQSMAITDTTVEAYSEAQDLLGNCQLEQAQKFATERSFRKAVETIQTISPQHPSFDEGQGLLESWSKEIIKIAQNEYQKENKDALSNAINIASAIPKDTTVYGESQALIEQWKKDWGSDEANFKAAKDAFEKNDWNTAAAKSKQIKTNFWNKEVSLIRQKAEANIAAAQRTQPVYSRPVQSNQAPSSARTRQRPARPVQTQPRPSAPPSEPRELPRDR